MSFSLKTIGVSGFAALALLGCAGGGDTAGSADAADYVFTNGNVYTVDKAQPLAKAIAFVGEGTEEVDLAGRTMMPGFVDAHNHALAGGLIARGMALETDDMDRSVVLWSRLYRRGIQSQDYLLTSPFSLSRDREEVHRKGRPPIFDQDPWRKAKPASERAKS